MEIIFSIILEAKKLFIRVKKESENAEFFQLALNMESFYALTLGNADEVIELLEGRISKIISTERDAACTILSND